MTSVQTGHTEADQSVQQYDVIIIGAGIAGMYQLYCLRKLGLSIRVFEAGGDVGGTWYWNRYPGARFDSESYTYGYSFSDEVLQEWDWTERFSAQPENLRYLNFVADKFDLRRDIQFNCRVVAAHYDEAANEWDVTTENGARARSRLLITALGPLSTPIFPNIKGIDSFRGESYHTGLWPHEPVDFTGKRVAVIGTGATGVQVIQEIAKTAGHLTVFQRTPNWCAPLHNGPIDPEEQQRIKETYPDIFAQCADTFACFIHVPDRRNALEVSDEEREAVYQRLYDSPGFGLWMGNFRDVLIDEAANATLSEFVAKKIRERVKDPAVAEKLIPRDHGFGTRRVPMETGYYEVYNQDNVRLVSLRETPIAEVTPAGIKTTEEEFELDMIVYATGFDAVIGAFNRIDFRGIGGMSLKEKWAEGPRTYLGLATAGFPNFFTIVGPHNASTFCNIPRCIEQNVEWVTVLIKYLQDKGYTRIEPTEDAEIAWTAHAYETAERMLFSKIDSWFMGINTNLAGRQKPRFLLYAGGAPHYRKRCDEIAANGYEGFVLDAPNGSR